MVSGVRVFGEKGEGGEVQSAVKLVGGHFVGWWFWEVKCWEELRGYGLCCV